MHPPIANPEYAESGANPNPTPQEPVSVRHKRGGWGMILLWLYALGSVGLIMFGVGVSAWRSFSTSGLQTPPAAKVPVDIMVFAVATLVPTALFLVLAGIKNFRK